MVDHLTFMALAMMGFLIWGLVMFSCYSYSYGYMVEMTWPGPTTAQAPTPASPMAPFKSPLALTDSSALSKEKELMPDRCAMALTTSLTQFKPPWLFTGTTPLPCFTTMCTTAQTPATTPPLVRLESWIVTREMSTAAISQRTPDLLSWIPHSSSPVNRRLSTSSMIPKGDLRRITKEDPKRQRDDWTLVAGVFISSWKSRVTGKVVMYGSFFAYGKPPWIC